MTISKEQEEKESVGGENDTIVIRGARGRSPSPGRRKKALFYKTKRWEYHLRGSYPQLAAFIAEDPDKSTNIFQKFERLGSQNLLYMEAEIEEKEDDLAILDSVIEERIAELRGNKVGADERDEIDLLTALQEDWTFVRMAMNADLEYDIPRLAKKKHELVVDIRSALEKYYEALKRTNQILDLSKPDRRALKSMKARFGPGGRNSRFRDGNDDVGAKRLSNEDDLCVLKDPPETDILTKWFEGKLAYFFRNKEGYVLHDRVDLWVKAISVTSAAILLIGAVLALYWVRSPGAQLGILAGFTIFFAGSLAILTNARRQDVFAAVAAYAAVLVVFVSGNLSPNSSKAAGSSEVVTTTVSSVVTVKEYVTPGTILVAGATSTASASTISVSNLTTEVIPATTKTLPPSAITLATSTVSASSAPSTTAVISHSTGLSGAAIGGIVGGTVGGLSLLVALIVIFYKRRTSSSKRRIPSD